MSKQAFTAATRTAATLTTQIAEGVELLRDCPDALRPLMIDALAKLGVRLATANALMFAIIEADENVIDVIDVPVVSTESESEALS